MQHRHISLFIYSAILIFYPFLESLPHSDSSTSCFYDHESWCLTYSQQEEYFVFEGVDPISFRGDERILHIGCGEGLLSHKLASFVPQGQVIGIDKIKLPFSQQKNLIFMQASIKEMDWKDHFDYIICTQTSEWDDRPADVLAAIREALKPEGKFFSLLCLRESLPAANPLFFWLNNDISAQVYAPYLQVGRNISYKDFRYLVGEAGFSTSACTRTKRLVASYQDIDLFKKEVANWFFHKIAELCESQKEECLSKILKVMIQEGNLRIGKYNDPAYLVFPYSMEICSGIK